MDSFWGWQHLIDEIGLRRMSRKVGTDRKFTVIQITIFFNNCGEQKSVSEFMHLEVDGLKQ